MKTDPAPSTSAYESNPFMLMRPSWEGVKLNAKSYGLLLAIGLGATAGAVLLGVIALGLMGPASFVLDALMVLVLLYLSITKFGPAYTRLQLAIARHQPLSLSEALAGQPAVGWRLFGAGLLAGLAAVGGLILFIVPGIIFATWFSLAGYFIIDQNLGVMESLRHSRQLVKNRFWDTLGANSLVQAVSLVALIPIIGWLVSLATMFIFAPVVAVRYDQLVHLKRAGDGSGMATSGWNYVVFILALLTFGSSSDHSLKQLKANSQPNSVEKTVQPY